MRLSPISCFFLAALLVAAGGCTTAHPLAAPAVLPDDGRHHEAVQRARETIAQLFPARYRSTQRAIITTGGKQFTCDGLLTVTPTNGHHLALASSFGTVTDLRVAPDGGVELLKVTPLFQADWSRRFIARDLRWIFIPPTGLAPAGRLADDRLVLQTAPDTNGVTAEYLFDAEGTRFQELDLLLQGRAFYRVAATHYVKFPGLAAEVPGEFEVSAEAYRLDLRLTTLRLEAQP